LEQGSIGSKETDKESSRAREEALSAKRSKFQVMGSRGRKKVYPPERKAEWEAPGPSRSTESGHGKEECSGRR